MCNALWGPWWFWLVDGCVNRDVLLFPPALVKTVLASSNMKCAPASEGWFGIDGYALLPLYLDSLFLDVPDTAGFCKPAAEVEGPRDRLPIAWSISALVELWGLLPPPRNSTRYYIHPYSSWHPQLVIIAVLKFAINFHIIINLLIKTKNSGKNYHISKLYGTIQTKGIL